MTERQYRLVNADLGHADPNLIYSQQQAFDIADRRTRRDSALGHRWIVQYRDSLPAIPGVTEETPGDWTVCGAYAKVEGGAAITARALTALRETAQALKAAGHDREFVDASLTVTCHADYVGLINGVLDEVFPPQAVYDICLADKVDRLDVMAALKVIAADWRVGARNVRPTCGDDPCFGHEGDDEISEAVADVYDECATTLLRAFGLPTDEEG